MFNGVDREWLKRWNGAAEPLADCKIEDDDVAAEAKLMWTNRSERV